MADIAFPISVAAATLTMIWVVAVARSVRVVTSPRAESRLEKAVCPSTNLC